MLIIKKKNSLCKKKTEKVRRTSFIAEDFKR